MGLVWYTYVISLWGRAKRQGTERDSLMPSSGDREKHLGSPKAVGLREDILLPLSYKAVGWWGWETHSLRCAVSKGLKRSEELYYYTQIKQMIFA